MPNTKTRYEPTIKTCKAKTPIFIQEVRAPTSNTRRQVFPGPANNLKLVRAQKEM